MNFTWILLLCRTALDICQIYNLKKNWNFFALPVFAVVHPCTYLPAFVQHLTVELCLPLAECIGKLPCGHGFLREDRQGDWQPCRSSERCHGGGTCMEGETQLLLKWSQPFNGHYRWHNLFLLNYSCRFSFPLVVGVDFFVSIRYLTFYIHWTKI